MTLAQHELSKQLEILLAQNGIALPCLLSTGMCFSALMWEYSHFKYF